jgi:ubiquinone biosynthesis protein COQ4
MRATDAFAPSAADAPSLADLARLPAPPRRPVQWRRAWRQVQLLWRGRPEDAVDAAYAIKDALGGQTDERLLRRMLADSTGRELLARRPRLPALLSDHSALARLPDGSFGRAYLAFCRRHRINAATLVESENRMSRDFGRLDPLRQWFSDRLTVLHDLWHVLGGYDATQPGESAMICFSLPQGLGYRPMPVFVVMLLLAGHLSPRRALEAFRRGRRAAFLVAQPYEELLPQPLEAVRRRLGLPPPADDHPGRPPDGMLIPAAAC